MRRLGPLLLLASLAAPAPGQTFTVPEGAAANRLVRMKADGFKWVMWFVEPSASVDIDESDSGDRAVWTAPAGRYVVQAVGLGQDDRPKKFRGEVVVVGTPPGPGPGPSPGPSPGPTPPGPTPPGPVVAGRLHATLFLGDLAQARLRTDPEIRRALAAADTVYRSYLTSEPEAQRYADLIKASGGPPCVIVQDDTGRVVGTGTVGNPADIVAVVAKLRGR